MKVALAYDRVNKWGGAEKLLLVLHEIWPKSPLFTAVYNPQTAPWAKVFRVIPSFLNRLPGGKTHHEWYPLLMPLAFESFDFSDYDLVISVTSEAAKGIITKPGTVHVCYCLTPTRYLYHQYHDYLPNVFIKKLAQPAINYLRRWDIAAAQRPDYFLAISKTVQLRIKKYYQRKAEVIYPPVDLEMFKCSNVQMFKDNYFLIVSRLVPYKRVDIAIEAFNQLGWPLKIIGVGQEMEKLKKIAKKNIEFFGFLPEEELNVYYQNCQALICPQEEDFGITSLEAQACGRPVIAYDGGGATETVIAGKTGLFFSPQTPQALIKAIKKFTATPFRSDKCRENAARFNQKNFSRTLKSAIFAIISG